MRKYIVILLVALTAASCATLRAPAKLDRLVNRVERHADRYRPYQWDRVNREYEALLREDLFIDAFLVTSMDGNPKARYGQPVREIGSADIPERSLIIIAMKEGFRREAEEVLKRLGHAYRYYRS